MKKNSFILSAITIALMIGFSSCEKDDDNSETKGSSNLAIQNYPTGTNCYITVYDCSEPIKNLGEMYGSISDWRFLATGKGTLSPIKINNALNGVFFLTINPGKYPYLYYEQVLFTKGEATVDWDTPTFTWDGSNDWWHSNE